MQLQNLRHKQRELDIIKISISICSLLIIIFSGIMNKLNKYKYHIKHSYHDPHGLHEEDKTWSKRETESLPNPVGENHLVAYTIPMIFLTVTRKIISS